MLFRALLHISVLLALAVPAFGQVYKWVDEKGVTHYGEAPPQGKQATEVPYRLASPMPGGNATNKSGTDTPQQAPQESAQRPPASSLAPVEEKKKSAAETRQAQCDQQRDLLARLRQAPPAYLLNEKGERIPVLNTEAIARQEKLVTEQCKS